MAIKINQKEINKVIKKGKPEDARELNLSKRNATELEDISFCKALQKIHLNENNLQKFDGLSKCEGLKWIDLSKNQIQKMSGMTRLLHLNVLNLSYNKIGKIEGLETLTELKVLVLNDNQISKVEGISHLTQLNTLILSDNKIENLGEIPKVHSLVKLSLSGNMLKDVSGLGSLVELTELRLNRNSLKGLPKTFSALSKLKILDIGNNQISDQKYNLPLVFVEVTPLARQISVISALSSLKNFNVKGNPYWDEKESESLTKAIIKLNGAIDHVNNRKVSQELKDQVDATRGEEEEKEVNAHEKEAIEEEFGGKPAKKVKKGQSKASKAKGAKAEEEKGEAEPEKEEEQEQKVVNKRQIGILKVSKAKPLMNKKSKVVSTSILSQLSNKNKSDAWD